MDTNHQELASRISPLHHRTPVLYSESLSRRLNKKVWLKMECYQPVGSYKIRGIGRLCQHYVSEGKHHLVSSSAGNAGIAVAYAAKAMGVSATIFLPSENKMAPRERIEALGATVNVVPGVWDEAHAAAQTYLASHPEAAYIPPFDHPLIWAGHATMMDEVVEAGVKPEVIVVAVGGGGLSCGVLTGLHAYGWQHVPLIATETEGTASFHASVEAGHLVTLPKIDSVAISLGAKRVCNELWAWRERHSIRSVTVTDEQAIHAVKSFLDDHHALVEPASGAALAVAYEALPVLDTFQSVLIVVCGGICVSLSQLTNGF